MDAHLAAVLDGRVDAGVVGDLDGPAPPACAAPVRLDGRGAFDELWVWCRLLDDAAPGKDSPPEERLVGGGYRGVRLVRDDVRLRWLGDTLRDAVGVRVRRELLVEQAGRRRDAVVGVRRRADDSWGEEGHAS